MNTHPAQFQAGDKVRLVNHSTMVATVVDDCTNYHTRQPMVFVEFDNLALPAQLILQSGLEAVR